MEGEGASLNLKNNGKCVFCKDPPASKELESRSVQTLFKHIKVGEVKKVREVKSELEEGQQSRFEVIDLQNSTDITAELCAKCRFLLKSFLDLETEKTGFFEGLEERKRKFLDKLERKKRDFLVDMDMKMELNLTSIQTRMKTGSGYCEEWMEYPRLEKAVMMAALKKLKEFLKTPTIPDDIVKIEDDPPVTSADEVYPSTSRRMTPGHLEAGRNGRGHEDDEQIETNSTPIILRTETLSSTQFQNLSLDNAVGYSVHGVEAADEGLNETGESNLATLNATSDQGGGENSSLSHQSSNEELENGGERDYQGENGEGNSELNDDGEKNSSSATQPEKKKRGRNAVDRSTKGHIARSRRSTSDKVNSSSSQTPSTGRRKRKSSGPSTSRNVKAKKPGIVEPTRTTIELPSTSSNLDRSKNSETSKDGIHGLPDLPSLYVNREVRRSKGGKCSLTEDKFLEAVGRNVANHPIVIHGSFGMGKTTFLVQMERKVLRKSFYFIMKKVAHVVKALRERTDEKERTDGKKFIWGVLQKLTGESNLKSGNGNLTEIFFDGFDNVQEKDRGLVLAFLKGVSVHFKSGIRMWIAVLSNDFSKIEKVLPDIEGFSIKPLSEASQVELIGSYWAKYSSEDRPKLLEFARKCIKGLDWNTQVKLGNPLQCLVIGSAFLTGENFLDIEASSDSIEAKDILAINDKGKNLLLEAASSQTFHTLKLILDLNKFDVNGVDSLGNSPLLLSVYAKDNIDCLLKLKLLMSRNEVDLDHCDENGCNLLNYSARFSSLDLLRYISGLKEFNNINCENDEGHTPLFNALFAKHDNFDSLKKVKFLIDMKANVLHLDKFDQNLLMFAASYASPECLGHILSLNKFDVNEQNGAGDTALFNSVDARHNANCLNNIKLLVVNRADLQQKSIDGSNLINVAGQYASLEVLEYVLNEGKWTQDDINNEDKNGDTPLLVTVFHYDHERIDSLEKIKKLINRGANVSHANKQGSNVLHYAAKFGSVKVLEYVIGLGKFDINCADNIGNTPLDYARMTDTEGCHITKADRKTKQTLLRKKGCKTKAEIQKAINQ